MKNLTLVVVCLAFVAGACKKKSEEGKKDEKPQAAAPATPNAPRPANPTRTPAVRRAVAPIAIEEVKDLVPTFDGAKVVKPIQKASVGERIETAMCFDKGELAEIGDGLKAKLTSAGWPTVNTRVHPQIKDRMGISAHKAPYVLTGTVQRGSLPDCAGDKGQTYVVLGVHKIENRPADGSVMGGGTAPSPGAVKPDLLGSRPIRPIPPASNTTPAPTPATPAAP